MRTLSQYRTIVLSIPRVVLVPGCNETHRGRGLCHKHYMMWREVGRMVARRGSLRCASGSASFRSTASLSSCRPKSWSPRRSRGQDRPRRLNLGLQLTGSAPFSSNRRLDVDVTATAPTHQRFDAPVRTFGTRPGLPVLGLHELGAGRLEVLLAVLVDAVLAPLRVDTTSSDRRGSS